MESIEASEKYLSYRGDTEYALRLVNSLRETYGHNDMPKMLSDFVFSIEVALQNAGVLDDGFNETHMEDRPSPAFASARECAIDEQAQMMDDPWEDER